MTSQNGHFKPFGLLAHNRQYIFLMAAKLEFAYNLMKIPLTQKAQFFSIYITILLYYLTVIVLMTPCTNSTSSSSSCPFPSEGNRALTMHKLRHTNCSQLLLQVVFPFDTASPVCTSQLDE